MYATHSSHFHMSTPVSGSLPLYCFSIFVFVGKLSSWHHAGGSLSVSLFECLPVLMHYNYACMQANTQQVQKRMSNPRTPAERAADIVEQVLATNGEDYLETRQSKQYWWQLALLDVKLFLGVAVSLLLCFAGLVLYLAVKVLLSALHWARSGGAPPVSPNCKRKTT